MKRKNDNILNRIGDIARDQEEFSSLQYSGADNYVVKHTESDPIVYNLSGGEIRSSTITFIAEVQANAFAELNYRLNSGGQEQVLDIRITRDLSLVGGAETTWLVILTNPDFSPKSYNITWIVSSFDEGEIDVF